ncbi:ABC transporter permease [Alkalimonas collagenimarina]|uniref:ABC transporter permease n=1 Tax=Alkalimonas collagenimarina TaxID=400390 RepID=A0ABT9GXW0_9GAMM|nr:ABC transporter permease [Alkalimonas collagenimarina]MDP4535858.1 ABC transporter permease [Alkalimonas collagenimarina]
MAAFALSLKRELSHLKKDKGDLFLTLGMMPLLCVFIWWIFSAGQPDSLPVAVVDYDQTSISRQFIRLADAAPGIALVHGSIDHAEAIDALRKRKVYAVLVVPKGFEAEVFSGTPADLVLQVNSQYSTYSSTIERHLSGAALTAGVAIGLERLQMQGIFIDAGLAMAMPISVNATPLFNEGPDYEVFLAATLIPALFHIIAMILVVSAVGRELRDGTAGQWLQTAENSLAIALSAKVLPFFIVINLYSALFIIYFQQLAPQSYSGNILNIWLTMVLMNSAAIAMGLLIVAATRNFRMGLSLAGFYSAPAFAYSGQAFPLVAMPDAAQYWASILPLTHWLQIYNQLWMSGAPMSAVYQPLAILLAMLVVASGLGFWLLSRFAFKPESWGAR